jgi:pyrroloquinoline quinone biosynthesis protein B
LRDSPICGVFLTNADLDHGLGLFSLREGGTLHIYGSRAIREILDESLGLTAVMNAFCGVVWHEPPETDFAPLKGANEESGSLSYRAIRLPGGPPLFAGERHRADACSIAYSIMDRQTGGQLLVAPDVAGFNDTLNEAMREADAVLFDGTFWSGDELQQAKAKARTAEEMGHVTVKDHSLARLKTLPARRKIYIHINNTNPILSLGSPERAAVVAAGIVVGNDGLEFDL